jgi:hypothetical protein
VLFRLTSRPSLVQGRLFLCVPTHVNVASEQQSRVGLLGAVKTFDRKLQPVGHE